VVEIIGRYHYPRPRFDRHITQNISHGRLAKPRPQDSKSASPCARCPDQGFSVRIKIKPANVAPTPNVVIDSANEDEGGILACVVVD
jgi:hypothetical protein